MSARRGPSPSPSARASKPSTSQRREGSVSEPPTDKLQREMKRVKGVGDYAAENLLKLVGRYDGLGLDSWVRPQFSRKHNKGRAASDEKIHRHYARFGVWRGLALWCDLTEDWLDESGNARW